MKRMPLVFAVVSVLAFACNFSTAALGSPVSPSTSTPALSPATDTAPAPAGTISPTATIAPPTPLPSVTCNGLSFYIDPKLASGFTCTTVPALSNPYFGTPQYTQASLSGYVLPNEGSAEVDVFSVQAYQAIMPPNGISSYLAQVQGLVAGATPGSTLPYLLTRQAAQLIYARYRVLHVPSGSGISYITAYGQNQVPLSRHDLFYTYQGVTQDGQYVIMVRMPVFDPILPAGNDLPSGVTLEQFQQNWAAYVAATELKLDAQREEGFVPNLALLSNLVNSIGYHP